MDSLKGQFEHYKLRLQAACGSEDIGPRPQELDNTRHTMSCSLAATPPILLVLVVAALCKRLLCPQRLRQSYSGSEDAPELEIASSGRRRVDSYAVQQGRLTSAVVQQAPTPGKPKRVQGKPKSSRGTSSATRGTELEPVLWHHRRE